MNRLVEFYNEHIRIPELKKAKKYREEVYHKYDELCRNWDTTLSKKLIPRAHILFKKAEEEIEVISLKLNKLEGKTNAD